MINSYILKIFNSAQQGATVGKEWEAKGGKYLEVRRPVALKGSNPLGLLHVWMPKLAPLSTPLYTVYCNLPMSK